MLSEWQTSGMFLWTWFWSFWFHTRWKLLFGWVLISLSRTLINGRNISYSVALGHRGLWYCDVWELSWGLNSNWIYWTQIITNNYYNYERMGMQFTIAIRPHWCSLAWVQFWHDSWPYFNISNLRRHHPGRPGPHNYITQEEGGQVIPPGAGFPFHHHLQLTGLQWR
jgi:hypothetical protein